MYPLHLVRIELSEVAQSSPLSVIEGVSTSSQTMHDGGLTVGEGVTGDEEVGKGVMTTGAGVGIVLGRGVGGGEVGEGVTGAEVLGLDVVGEGVTGDEDVGKGVTSTGTGVGGEGVQHTSPMYPFPAL